jgi:hypothetical protein
MKHLTIRSLDGEGRTSIFAGYNEKADYADCLVFAEGSLEWQKEQLKKQPLNNELDSHLLTIIFADIESVERVQKGLESIHKSMSEKFLRN